LFDRLGGGEGNGRTPGRSIRDGFVFYDMVNKTKRKAFSERRTLGPVGEKAGRKREDVVVPCGEGICLLTVHHAAALFGRN